MEQDLVKEWAREVSRSLASHATGDEIEDVILAALKVAEAQRVIANPINDLPANECVVLAGRINRVSDALVRLTDALYSRGSELLRKEQEAERKREAERSYEVASRTYNPNACIWAVRDARDAGSWFREPGNGLTRNPALAHRFTADEALKAQAAEHPPSDVIVCLHPEYVPNDADKLPEDPCDI